MATTRKTARKRTTTARKRTTTKLFKGVRIPTREYRKVRYYDAYLRVNKARKSGSAKASNEAYEDLFFWEPAGCEHWSATRYAAYIKTAHAVYSKYFKAPALRKPASGFYQP